jgi:acyl-CoA thioesterase-1
MNWKILCFALLMGLLPVAGHAQEVMNSKKIVVVYGDSITVGEQLKSSELARRWTSQVESQGHGTFQVANEGKGGRPTGSLAEFEAMLKRQPRADLLVIALGANDARDTSGHCVPNAVRNLKAMVARARATYGATVPLLLVGPTNINKNALGPTKAIGPQREANLLALNAAYLELSKTENIAFVSTYGVLPDDSLTLDGVHPDATGHDELAKVMLPAIVQTASITFPR